MNGKLIFPQSMKELMIELAVDLNDSKLVLALSQAKLPVALIKEIEEDPKKDGRVWGVRKEDGVILRSKLQEEELKNGAEVFFEVEQGKRWACNIRIKPSNLKKK